MSAVELWRHQISLCIYVCLCVSVYLFFLCGNSNFMWHSWLKICPFCVFALNCAVLCCASFVFHWFDFYLNWIIYWVYCISNCNAILWFCLVVKLNFYSLFNFYCFTLLYFHSFVIIQLDWMWFFRYKMSGSILLLLRREKEILNGWDMWCF